MLRSGRNDARDLHGCDCASLQCANCHTAARHNRFDLRMSRRSWQRLVGSKERYIASAHRSERNQAVGLSDVYTWPWIGIELNWQSERTERENN